MKRGISRRGALPLPESLNGYYLILFIGLFLILYIVFLPEGQKEQLVGQTGPSPLPPGGVYGGGYAQTSRQVLFSQSIGSLQPFGQKIFSKPLASLSLYSNQQKDEEVLSKSLSVAGGFFSGQEKDLAFKINQNTPVDSVKVLLFLEKAQGDITLTLNGREIFSGPLTASQLPLILPASSLRAVNHLTFSVSSGIFHKNAYILRDITVFRTYRIEHVAEQRTFVLSQEDSQRFNHLGLFYIVNCFTVQEKGNLLIALNGKVISQEQIVCDAGEVSHDLLREDLHQGRNTLDFQIDNGNFVLERMLLEGELDAGKAPGYFFSAPSNGNYFMDLAFGNDNARKIATFYINGYPVSLDTYASTFSFDISPYVIPGQNSLRIVAETPFDVASLDISLA